MNKTYNPKDIEHTLYKHWEKKGYFKPNYNTQQDSYCIMLPPPNITGTLHMGHAFQQILMDILIRYHRMQGKNTLWQSGTDHAGIATQMVVERNIAIKEGKTRYDYGRDAFIKKIWQWKTQSGNTITDQMRRLGNSIDWEREQFTMNDQLSNAVKEVFICLYRENLIYRGKRLVNWDPKLRTAISDLEVEHRESTGFIWYLRYPLAEGERTADGLDYLVVATTRPETMLGDTGIAVHPEDLRYRHLIGKLVILPLVNRCIPIVGDTHADMTKNSGCVKITPAHDFNDYEVGKRHALPMINTLTFEGYIRHTAEIFNTNGEPNHLLSNVIPKFLRGLERFTARKRIIEEFDRLGFLVKINTHDFKSPYGDRSGVVIEPMLTNQWYVRVKPLAKIAIETVKKGVIQFIPKQYENMYFSWMKDIKDWCISRQIWWGHRIPAWYDTQGNVYVGRSEIEVRDEYQLGSSIILCQDDDVLDTWFSSGLWTFSTLGWPENTKILKIFHPTSVVVSGFDIIFFWIARMIMLTMYFVKNNNGKPQVPFKTVYITGLIRDEEGQKMSKSKGNIIDPLDMIDGISLAELIKKRTNNMMQPQMADKIRKKTKKQFPKGIEMHGTDALRLTLTALASTGRDIHWDMKRLKGYRNFCNKLWNASRFVLINTNNQDCSFYADNYAPSLADNWILEKFNQTVKTFRHALDNYRFDLAVSILYEFTWNQFCDWYIEFTKPVISNGSDAEQRSTRYTLIKVLESLLRLAHPIIPFITETIWQKIKPVTGIKNDTIMLESFPIYDTALSNTDSLNDLEWIKELIIAVRTIRSEMNLASSKTLTVLLRDTSPTVEHRVKNNLSFILNIGKIHSISILSENNKGPAAFTQLIDGAELMIPITELCNINDEIKRLTKEITRIDNEIIRIYSKIDNEQFIRRAPESIVDKERNKLKLYQKSKEKLLAKQSMLMKLL